MCRIQGGKEGRKSDSNVYVRSVMIQKETIGADASLILDKGILSLYILILHNIVFECKASFTYVLRSQLQKKLVQRNR